MKLVAPGADLEPVKQVAFPISVLIVGLALAVALVMVAPAAGLSSSMLGLAELFVVALIALLLAE